MASGQLLALNVMAATAVPGPLHIGGLGRVQPFEELGRCESCDVSHVVLAWS